MRRAEIYYKDIVAGILTETNDGQYTFQYDKECIAKHPDIYYFFYAGY